jgi:hypothetical protein
MFAVILLVSESSAALTTPLPITTLLVTTQSSTTVPPPPRLCGPIQLEYCSKLPYNVTSYPNKLGHRSLKEVLEDVIAFRYFYLCTQVTLQFYNSFNYLSFYKECSSY